MGCSASSEDDSWSEYPGQRLRREREERSDGSIQALLDEEEQLNESLQQMLKEEAVREEADAAWKQAQEEMRASAAAREVEASKGSAGAAGAGDAARPAASADTTTAGEWGAAGGGAGAPQADGGTGEGGSGGARAERTHTRFDPKMAAEKQRQKEEEEAAAAAAAAASRAAPAAAAAAAPAAAPEGAGRGGGGSEAAGRREAEERDPTAARRGSGSAEENAVERLAEHRAMLAQAERDADHKEAIRARVVAELHKRMMGLHMDPRVVLQVLGVPVKADNPARPSNAAFAAAFKKALVMFHPDRQARRVKDGSDSDKDDTWRQVEAEEIYKLVSEHRDRIQELLAAESFSSEVNKAHPGGN